MARTSERIAVTGLGIVSALGMGARPVFERLCTGERGFRPISLFDAAGLSVTQAAQVGDAPALAGDSSLSRTDRLAILAAREALETARLPPGTAPQGLVVGTTASGMLETEAEFLRDPEGPLRARRLVTAPLSVTARAIDRELGPFSSRATVCSACSSGAVAIVQAAAWISMGKARAVLAGGADALCRMTFAGFHALGALDPEPCRPFDSSRAGLTLGEGAGFLMLEAESSARARGARVFAWLSGYAIGAEAHHITHPDPSGVRAAALLTRAIERAGLRPEDIDAVNAHGTGTLANDAMEAAALRGAFGTAVGRPWVSSNKGQLGHSLGAAGAIEAVLSVLTLVQGRVPPNGGLRTAEASDLRLVGSRAEECSVASVLSNSFGFGGMNAALLFEHEGAKPRGSSGLRAGLVVSAVSAGASPLWVDTGCSAALEAEGGAARSDADPRAELDAARSRRFDRSTALAIRAAEGALASAGLTGTGVGLVLGSAYGPVDRSLAFLDRILVRGLKSAAPAEFPHLLHSAGAGNTSIYLGLDGPVLSTSEGATSAEAALALALAALNLGLCESILTGAAEAHDPAVSALAPQALPDLPGTRGEGVGIALVELEETARSRGKVPLARLVAHASDHGLANDVLTSAPEVWVAPDEPRAAKLLLCSVDRRVDLLIDESEWSDVERIRLFERLPFHEALGGVALSLAAALVATGTPEVLLVSGSIGSLYMTRLARFSGPQ